MYERVVCEGEMNEMERWTRESAVSEDEVNEMERGV